MSKTCIVWLRQDLRLKDNPALYYGAQDADTIIPLYIYSIEMPKPIGAAQQWWLHHSLTALEKEFQDKNINLIIRQGEFKEELKKVIEAEKADSCYWNYCYEPQILAIDENIKAELVNDGINVKNFNASLLNSPWKIKNNSGSFFKVFTPYWKFCLSQMPNYKPLAIPKMQQKNVNSKSIAINSLNLLPTKPNWAQGLEKTWKIGEKAAHKNLKQFIDNNLKSYATARDEIDIDGTSKMSPHLHFGEISPWHIWQAVQIAWAQDPSLTKGAERYLAELGWREFSYNLLYNFKNLQQDNFRSEFDKFKWVKNKNHLTAWQRGQTGYPIVDAGMMQLWQTGYMHNRVRMIVASFLTKDLLLHWREGEIWFWDTLVDADMASNAASWQWVAGCGADAAPYFRIFNPTLQGEKFDPDGAYVKKWLPELAKMPKKYIHKPWEAPNSVLQQAQIELGKNYPKPIIDHKTAREKALLLYKEIKKG